jgi:hypothetical protein
VNVTVFVFAVAPPGVELPLPQPQVIEERVKTNVTIERLFILPHTLQPWIGARAQRPVATRALARARFQRASRHRCDAYKPCGVNVIPP